MQRYIDPLELVMSQMTSILGVQRFLPAALNVDLQSPARPVRPTTASSSGVFSAASSLSRSSFSV